MQESTVDTSGNVAYASVPANNASCLYDEGDYKYVTWIRGWRGLRVKGCTDQKWNGNGRAIRGLRGLRGVHASGNRVLSPSNQGVYIPPKICSFSCMLVLFCLNPLSNFH